MDEKKKVAQAAGKVSGGTLVSRIAGFIRDILLAKIFGATGYTDAFFVAFRIPNLLREFFAEGSVSSGYVPVFTEYLKKEGRDEAKKLAGTVFAFLFSVLIIICLLGILFAPFIAFLVAPNFVNYPDKMSITVTLLRIMFPFLLFISIAALAMGTLNSLGSFFIPAIAPAFFNLSIIATALFLTPHFPTPILSIGIGVTAGGALQYFIQAFYLSKMKFSLRPVFSFLHAGLKRIILLVLPVVAAMGVIQINVLISNIFATYLSEGSVTYLYYGYRLIQFPIGLFGVSMAMALLPSLSQHFTDGDLQALKDTFSFSLRLVFFTVLPAMAGLIALSQPIVSTLFQRGEFTSAATSGTAYSLIFYSSGLWAFAGLRIVRTTFYSLQDTMTPLKIALISVLVNIFFCVILRDPFQHGGLALALVIATAVNFVILSILLRLRLGRIGLKKTMISFAKSSFAAFVMGISGWFITRGDIWLETGKTLQKIGTLVGVMSLCIFIYILLMRLMGSDELSYLLKIIFKKKERAS
jgi:putative peptidoglycan lipid II flippase